MAELKYRSVWTRNLPKIVESTHLKFSISGQFKQGNIQTHTCMSQGSHASVGLTQAWHSTCKLPGKALTRGDKYPQTPFMVLYNVQQHRRVALPLFPASHISTKGHSATNEQSVKVMLCPKIRELLPPLDYMQPFIQLMLLEDCNYMYCSLWTQDNPTYNVHVRKWVQLNQLQDFHESANKWKSMKCKLRAAQQLAKCFIIVGKHANVKNGEAMIELRISNEHHTWVVKSCKLWS